MYIYIYVTSNYLSPFAKRARELPKYKYYIGGKSDDITVIVAEISKCIYIYIFCIHYIFV